MKRIEDFSVNDTFAIKGIAIMLMYIHHNFLSPARWGKCIVDFWPLTEKITINIAVFCKICVSLFVFLTAYGLTIKYKELIQEKKFSMERLNFAFVFNRLYKLELNFWFVFVLVQIYSVIMGMGRFTYIYGSGGKAVFKSFIDGLGLAYLFKMPSFNATWWYMSLAIIIVLSFPVLFFCYKHIGGIIIILSWILPIALKLPIKGDDFYRYLPCIFMGIWLADNNYIFSRCGKWCTVRGMRKALFGCLGIIIIVMMAFLSTYSRKILGDFSVPVFNAILAPMLVIWAFCVIKEECLWQGLSFLGRHSMNMFMTHTFLRAYWYHDFIYGFKYAWLDTLVLLVITLALSIIIEGVKNISGYNRLVNRKIFS
jgi:hypothetical protein